MAGEEPAPANWPGPAIHDFAACSEIKSWMPAFAGVTMWAAAVRQCFGHLVQVQALGSWPGPTRPSAHDDPDVPFEA